MRELVRGYAVDGLHLDFIRYPGPSFDYSRAALEGFRRAQRRARATCSATPARNPAAWDDYRRAGADGADDAAGRRGARRAAGHR